MHCVVRSLYCPFAIRPIALSLPAMLLAAVRGAACPLFVAALSAAVAASSPAHAWAAEIAVEKPEAAAVVEAIGRAAAGDTVRLPAGTIVLTEPLRLRSGLRIIGAGQDRTILVSDASRAGPIVLIDGCESVELAHLTIDGRMRDLVQDGIGGRNAKKIDLNHLTIRNLKAGKGFGPHAIYWHGHGPTRSGGVVDSRIAHCTIENIGVGAEFGGGIRVAHGSHRNLIEQNTIRTTGRGGIFGDNSDELVIRNNTVTGSGGEGLGIEIWGGCPRSLIEDNRIDHWLSVDAGHQSAVRRNIIGAVDGSIKGYGIEIIAENVVVTDNTVRRGAAIGLSVSNKPRKNNVLWAYNTVEDCIQWGAQLQGEDGGIAHHYFYRCEFRRTVRGDRQARYPGDSGHGFRFNGDCRNIVFEQCTIAENGGFGLQIGGKNVDGIFLLRCRLADNALGPVVGLQRLTAFEAVDTTVAGPKAESLSAVPRSELAWPTADFRLPPRIVAGEPARFACASQPGSGRIVERLWDFNDGIPQTTAEPSHRFAKPGKYRVTLVVWDSNGRAARAEKTIEVVATFSPGPAERGRTR